MNNIMKKKKKLHYIIECCVFCGTDIDLFFSENHYFICLDCYSYVFV